MPSLDGVRFGLEFPAAEERGKFPALIAVLSALLSLALGNACFLAGCAKKKPPAQPGPPEVSVTPVLRRDVPIYREWIGTLDGAVNAEIRPQVSGYLIAQNYKEGSLVKRGALLFQIDPRPLEATLDQAKANLAKAKAAQFKADLDEQRSRILFTRNVISAQERDQAVEAAGAARADTQAQQAALQTAELNLGFTKIVAPVEGIAGIAKAQIGDLVGPSGTNSLTTVSVIDPIKAYVTVSEQAYIDYTRRYMTMASRARHEEELRMELILADGSVFPYPGRFYAVERQVDPTTGALRFAGLFPNPNRVLRPGQFCRVRAKTETRKGALLVPQRAVMELQGSYQVAVVGSDGRVNIRNVTPGDRVGTLWIIEKGLGFGDTVVVEGVQKVHEGGLVSAKPWTPPPDFFGTPAPTVPPGPLPTIPPELFSASPAPMPTPRSETPRPLPHQTPTVTPASATPSPAKSSKSRSQKSTRPGKASKSPRASKPSGEPRPVFRLEECPDRLDP